MHLFAYSWKRGSETFIFAKDIRSMGRTKAPVGPHCGSLFDLNLSRFYACAFICSVTMCVT